MCEVLAGFFFLDSWLTVLTWDAGFFRNEDANCQSFLLGDIMLAVTPRHAPFSNGSKDKTLGQCNIRSPGKL